MKRFPYLWVIFIIVALTAFSCRKKQPAPEKVVSFDPADSVLVDELMRFYVENHIIPEEALAFFPNDGELFTFDCLSENCFVSHDYMQDSLSGTFFTEVEFETGSSGNNTIYICRRAADGFSILLTTEGQIQSELAPDTLVNGYRVLYLNRPEQTLRLFFNGTTFITEDIPTPSVVTNEETLTSN